MTDWLWAANVAVLIFGTVTAIRAGRAAALAWLDRVAQLVLCLGIAALARRTLGWPLGLAVVPPAAVAVWFGGTTLGTVNFLVLQWFGVRLGRVVRREFTEATVTAVPLDQHSDAAIASAPGTASWTVLRWILPLTGWWSEYRWIARRT